MTESFTESLPREWKGKKCLIVSSNKSNHIVILEDWGKFYIRASHFYRSDSFGSLLLYLNPVHISSITCLEGD